MVIHIRNETRKIKKRIQPPYGSNSLKIQLLLLLVLRIENKAFEAVYLA